MPNETNGTKRIITMAVVAFTVPVIMGIGGYFVMKERLDMYGTQLAEVCKAVRLLELTIAGDSNLRDRMEAVRDNSNITAGARLLEIEREVKKTREDVIKIKAKLGIE